MAKDQTRRLKPALLQQDKNVLSALKAMLDYTPQRPELSLTELDAKLAALTARQEAEVQAEAAAAAARDATAAAEWAFHNAILGAKAQVKAQYGEDSDELQSVGLKKKSEVKRPVARPTTLKVAA